MIGLGEIAHNVIFGPKWSEFGPIWSKRAPVVFWRSFKHRRIVRHQYLDMSTAICQNWLFDSRENQITDIVKGHTLKKGVARYHFWNKMGPTRVLTCISLGYFQKTSPAQFKEAELRRSYDQIGRNCPKCDFWPKTVRIRTEFCQKQSVLYFDKGSHITTLFATEIWTLAPQMGKKYCLN